MAMIGLICVLTFGLHLADASSSSSPTFKIFSNNTAHVTSSAPITTSPSSSSSSSLSALSDDSGTQNCSFWPLEFKTGYWSSLNIPITTIGTIYYIVNTTTNTTSTTTEFSSEVVVTDIQSASSSNSSANVQTVHGSDLVSNTLAPVLIASATKSDTIRLVDGSWATLTYPNGILDVTDSFYWRGTVSYPQGGSTSTASNIGPFSAPGYLQWGWHDEAWLPPSPLPNHGAWPKPSQTVDPSDPFGLKHVFIRGDECDYEYDYLMGYFTDAPITAVVDICTPPSFKCNQDMFSWVTTVRYLLDTSVVSTGETPVSANVFQNIDKTPNGDQTVNTRLPDPTPRTGGKDDNTNNPPKHTPAPGPTVPHATPKETKTPKQTRKTEPTHEPAPGKTHTRGSPDSIENTRGGRVHTKTNSEHEEDHPYSNHETTEDTRIGDPKHTPRPTNAPKPKPIVQIGTESATLNSDSEYVLSGKTLAPGATVTFGSGPSATTIAISTRGKATYVISNGVTSKLQAAPQRTGSSEVLIGSKTLSTGGSVVVSGVTYSLAPGGSTIFVDGHPEKVTLNSKTHIATLSNGVVITETQAPGAGSETTSRFDESQHRATTYVAILPEILLGSKTLSAGSSVVLSGTTYSLGGRGSTLYIDGEPTRIPWADGTSIITLPNGVVATETAATTTVTSSPSETLGLTPSVPPASNTGHVISGSWAAILIAAASLVFSSI